VFPGGGQKVLAFQGDLTWSDGPLELYGNFGWATDEDVNGSVAGTPEDTWYYGAAEGVYNFTPKLYAAARYSAAFADKQANGANTVESDGWVDRIQVGGGYWATDTILVKAEYVYQKYHDFDQAGGQVSGVDAWLGPEFNGVISEVSFAF
jgi:hypothetical protein